MRCLAGLTRLHTLLALSITAAAAAGAAACGDDSSSLGADAGPGAVDAPPGSTDAPPGTPDAAPGTPDAGTVSAADPAADGPFGVKQTDATAGNGQGAPAVTVFAPSSDGGSTVASGTFPVIVVSPGFQMPRSEYAAYAHRLATHGFIAITQDFGGGFAPDHNQLAMQTKSVIDWALAGGGGLVAGHTSGKVGVCGHSMGGKISFLTATMDARIGAVVGWDPVDASSPSVAPELMGQVNAPFVVLGETTDGSGGFMPCAPTADNYDQYYMAGKSPAIEITVAAADHMDFVDDPSCGLCGFCTAGTADAADVHALASRTTVAAFRRYLNGETAMDAYLVGAVIQQDVNAGKVTVQHK
jgi:dienelactone hydrolase